MKCPLLVVCFLLFSMEGVMPDENFAQASKPTPSPNAVRLPYEKESSSELLSANHVFSVEIVSLQERPWTRAADGLEHRGLQMNVRLLEAFKGTLDAPAQSAFPVEVSQTRESAFVTSDYQGLWSHISPASGTKYLVLADGSSNSPAALMQEGHCQKLLGSEYIPDVHLAIEAEGVRERGQQAEGESPNEHDAVQALISFSSSRRSRAKDLYERYMWAFVRPAFHAKRDQVLSRILEMIGAADDDIDFRSGLISDVYDATVDSQPDPDLTRRVLRTFFSLLLQKDSVPLQEGLVEVEIYGLAFDDDKPAFKADSILPDHREREQLRAILASFDSERARAVAAWLSAR